jgi:hypothetical protein
MSVGIGDGSSAASYDRFNAGVNTGVSITSVGNTGIGDKSQVHGTKENQALESVKGAAGKIASAIANGGDSDVNTDGVNNSIDNPPPPNEKALTQILYHHSDMAL